MAAKLHNYWRNGAGLLLPEASKNLLFCPKKWLFSCKVPTHFATPLNPMPPNQNPYKWEVRHFQLRDALAYLVPFPQKIQDYANQAGINAAMIPWLLPPYDVWTAVIDEAIKNRKVQELVNAALKSFPSNPFLLAAASPGTINYTPGPKLGEDMPWRNADAQTLEALTQKDVNTILPIGFLEQGVNKSRSVAKIQYRTPDGIVTGSGFLTDDNIFITNYHVIPYNDVAANATILFNFEDDINGNPKAAEAFQPDSKRMVIAEKLDMTAMRLKTDANGKYGALPLKPPFVPLQKNQFVNIIQHPAGYPKKIAMYHNIVTTVEDITVQYLTDTLQGSSGSPVFNSDWDVVALHHSGGRPTQETEKEYLCRNEGINILRIIEFLADAKKQGKI
jgi:V8-like Glu-specific endopeptidase